MVGAEQLPERRVIDAEACGCVLIVLLAARIRVMVFGVGRCVRARRVPGRMRHRRLLREKQQSDETEVR